MEKAKQWLNDQLEIWERRFDQLDSYVLTRTKGRNR